MVSRMGCPGSGALPRSAKVAAGGFASPVAAVEEAGRCGPRAVWTSRRAARYDGPWACGGPVTCAVRQDRQMVVVGFW